MQNNMVNKLTDVAKIADLYIAEQGQHGRVQSEKTKVMDHILKLMEIDAQIRLANQLEQFALTLKSDVD